MVAFIQELLQSTPVLAAATLVQPQAHQSGLVWLMEVGMERYLSVIVVCLYVHAAPGLYSTCMHVSSPHDDQIQVQQALTLTIDLHQIL